MQNAKCRIKGEASLPDIISFAVHFVYCEAFTYFASAKYIETVRLYRAVTTAYRWAKAQYRQKTNFLLSICICDTRYMLRIRYVTS